MLKHLSAGEITDFGDLNLKLPLILAISVFMSNLNFMLCRVEHEKCFITCGPVLLTQWSRLFITGPKARLKCNPK